LARRSARPIKFGVAIKLPPGKVLKLWGGDPD
jgi:hypothetical protein